MSLLSFVRSLLLTRLFRMDDLDSAIYYSAWNACIAETTKRFPVDI